MVFIMMENKLSQLLHNKNLWGYIVSIIILIVISLAFFHPDAIEGNSLSQADMRQGAANGQEIKEYYLETGVKSWWTNSIFSGMPTFQISPTYPSDSLFKWIDKAMQAGLPSPSGYLFAMMFGFLILGMCLRMRWYYALIGSVAWGLSSYFIIIIGAGHLWKFFTLTYVPPVIGGVIMTYRGNRIAGTAVAALFAMMQIAANHIQMSYYFLFLIIAFAIAFFVSELRNGQIKKWIISTCCMMGAAVLAIAANSPSLYNTYKYSKETIRGQHSLLSSGNENNISAGLDKDYITQYSYGRVESLTLLIPNIKGGASIKPVAGKLESVNVADLPEASKIIADNHIDPNSAQYLQYVSQYFGEPEATNGPVYVGAIICALFLLGCFIVKGPVKWALTTVTILSLLLAMGRNCMWLTDLFIDFVPMYKNFRTPESILVLAEFAMPLMAILALAKFFNTPQPLTVYRKQLYWSFFIPAFFCIIGIIFPSMFGDVITQTDYSTSAMIGSQLNAMGYPPEFIYNFSIDNPAIFSAVTELRTSMIVADSWRSLIFIAVTFILIFVCRNKTMAPWVTIAGIGVLVLGDLYTADKRYLNHGSFTTSNNTVDDAFPLSQNDRIIKADTAMNFRVMDIPRFWDAAPSYHHKMIGGYHAAKLTRYQDIIDRHLMNFYSGAVSDADWKILDMLNAKYVINPNGQLSLNTHALGNAWIVDNIEWVDGDDAEMDALDKINPATTAVISNEFKNVISEPIGMITPGDTIFETSYAPDCLTYHAKVSEKALAVFSEVYFPWGWVATVNDKVTPIVRADYLLRAIELPPGESSVKMIFDPSTVKSTIILAYIAVILIYLLCGTAIANTMIPIMHRKC